MKRGLRRAAWIALGLALIATATRVPAPPGSVSAPATLGGRLLAPFAGPLSTYERLEAEKAFIEGRVGAGLEHLARALRLAPGTSVLWESLVERQGLWLASSLREPDLERRRAWVEGALASAERGVASADRPWRVAYAAATVLHAQAAAEPPPAWPGGVPALWRAAAGWYARAGELGDRRGAAAASWCEARAVEAELAPPR